MTTITDYDRNPVAAYRLAAYIYPYDPATQTTLAFIYGSGADLGALIPGNYVEGRVVGYGFRQSLFSAGKLSGRSTPADGTLTLRNDDGALDAWVAYGWAGRRMNLVVGFISGTIDDYDYAYCAIRSVAIQDDSVPVSFSDGSYYCEKEFQNLKYSGIGNALPGGVYEGTADLAGRRKPDVYGVCNNVEPVYLGLGAGKHRFAVGSSAIIDVVAVYDRGVPLTYNPGITTPPVAGEWTPNLDRGVITLGGNFNGPVTCDVIGRRYKSRTSPTSVTLGAPQTVVFATTAGVGVAFTVGETVRAVATSDTHSNWMQGTVTAVTDTSTTLAVSASAGTGTYNGWTLYALGTPAGIMADIATRFGFTPFAAAVAALETLQPNTIGYYIPEGGLAGEILDTIADGTGCYWWIDRFGQFRPGRIDVPTTYTDDYDATDIIDIERLPIDDPSSSIRLRRQKNWKVFSTDQIAGAADDRKTFLINEWRWRDYYDAAMAAAYPLGKDLTIDSLFAFDSANDAELQRLIAMYGTRRDYFRVRLKLPAIFTPLGATVKITHPRYGLAAGKLFVVVDYESDLAANEISLGLWG